MNLLETARALDDQAFRWRVTAASLHHATTFQSMPPGHEQNYAVWQLLNPQTVDVSMLGLVALHEGVSCCITVENGTVRTDDVPDNAILTAVRTAWPLVAAKYPTNPLDQG